MNRLQLIAWASLAFLLSAAASMGQLPDKRPASAAAGERQARTREKPASAPKFTPEEREKRRQQIKERLNRQVADLEKRKANGTISDEEKLKLRRLQQLAIRFHRQSSSNGATVVGTPANNSSPAKAPARSP